ncbi:MAG: trypsin-like peptidase domain-containing protein [Candidatus Rokubacteria bacterium]|nr:trypsin-like peptidase domain-containing protein [Candidatus Rokubacteria bacterium]MBI2492129.1 trypsin-like peptidase domain-containing protein [Candidatus Rokubacteria bacterium]
MTLARSRTLVALLLAVGLLVGCAGPTGADARNAIWKESPGAAAAPELQRFNTLLADLADTLKSGLVHVRTRRATPAPAAEAPPRPEPGEPRRSTGSGFVIDASGLIVTNAHVVAGADAIQVRLSDGRRFAGRVVGRDTRVDLALLKIDGAANLTVLPLGDSNRLRVGEFVLALGHPFGLEQSVSFGIVSRKGAPLALAAPGFDFIQTDAAINPGNSGGPLVNMAGQVVGINSMAARNGSIGFAIPANLVKMLLPQLVAKGRVDWGWFGVSIAEVTDEDAARLKLREARGVLVRGVMPGEPAAAGGVRPDDVIVAIDGTPLDTPRDLQRVVSATPVGTKVRVALVRDGRETEVEVTVGLYKERPAPPRAAPPGRDPHHPPDGPGPQPGGPRPNAPQPAPPK